MSFPNWAARLGDFFALEGSPDIRHAPDLRRIALRVVARGDNRGRDRIRPGAAFDFIRAIGLEAGLEMPNDFSRDGSFQLPIRASMDRLPQTIQELVDFMRRFEETYNVYQARAMYLSEDEEEDEEDLPDQAEPVAQGPEPMPEGYVQEPQQGPDYYEPPTEEVREYYFVVIYGFPGWAGEETYVMPGTYAVPGNQVQNFTSDSQLTSAERVDLFFGTITLVPPEEIKPGGASGIVIYDAYIIDPDDANTATTQTGQGVTPASSRATFGVTPPTAVPDFHADLGFRAPATRLSYDDSSSLRVDHPGVRFSARLIEEMQPASADFTDPWLRANYVSNCCWMSCIINLVNTAMRRKVLTYERLWSIMGKPGVFDPAEARDGYSISDMLPVFEYFDRTVTVLDGENRVVYQRERSPKRRRNHIRPEVWSFLMTEHHVVCLNESDLFKANIDRKRLIFGGGGCTYVEAVVDHPYELVSPEFPAGELKKPRVLESIERKDKTQKLHSPINAERTRKAPAIMKLMTTNPDELLDRDIDHPDMVTLHEALFHHRYDNCHLTIIATRQIITKCILILVQTYKYRPRVAVDTTGDICSIMILSLDNRASVTIKTLIPGGTIHNEAKFESVAQVKLYMSTRHDLMRSLLRCDHMSYMHESVSQLCHTYTRGGVFHRFDASCLTNPSVKYNSCDVNRLYPSTLLVDEMPVVDLYDRFEKIDSLDDYERLKPTDLILVTVNDSAQLYCDKPVNLCFKKNLERFAERPNVYIGHPQAVPAMAERPTGTTIITPVAVLCTHTVPTGINAAVQKVWLDESLPRWIRKFVLNMSIGSLGKRYNKSKCEISATPCFCNREEAGLHHEETGNRIISVMDELFFGLEQCEQVPRLQGGYLMHLWVLDHARMTMQETYDKLVDAGVTVVAVQCDELFYPASQQHLVDQFIYDGDSEDISAFGDLKLHAQGITEQDLPTRRSGEFYSFLMPSQFDYNMIDETVVPMGRLTTIDVKPEPDEYNIENISDHTRLLVKANVPGAGKSHSILSRFQDECVVVCPTNSLCVEFKRKYPGCYPLTLHRFLRIRMNDDKEEAQTKHSVSAQSYIEANKILLLDEVFMYPQHLLTKLYTRLIVTQAKAVYATGDPNQLPPVDDDKHEKVYGRNKENEFMDDDVDFLLGNTGDGVDSAHMTMHQRRIRSIDHLFPKQMTLSKCKRASTAEDNERMENICKVLRDPFAEVGAIDVVKRHFISVQAQDAVAMLANHPDQYIAVCYYNATCRKIASLVHPQGVVVPGNRLVNRKLYQGKGGKLQVNYEYTVKEVSETSVTLEDDEKNTYITTLAHATSFMMWWRTRTCHSLQGTSVSGSVILFDLDSIHMTKEFIYVALTRARNLSTVCYVRPVGS